jgi:DNA uptake protein ComE-like DNA-binding protein
MKTIRTWILVLSLAATSGTAVAQVGQSDMVNPNLATEQELGALPHLTADQVQGIMAERPFLTMTDLDAALTSLSDEQRDALYRAMFIPLNLNSASKAEILLIPGVGNRMLREFEEYRPYMALAQFQREMGKYVDDAEVARLSGYVFVPIDLNTASDEDILSIPGVGSRMEREFKEYRPYQSLAQFRREMGKYVDDKEVARLERYVMIK